MPKALVVCYSRSGNTRKMAEMIAAGIKKEGLEVTLQDAQETQASQLREYDAIIIGTPVYYGTMAAQIKKLFDDSVAFHGKLDGKVGAAFSSSANIGGGNETAVLDILNAMLIHGMILQGDWQGDHYGPVSIGLPDERVAKECARFGSRIAKLARKVA
ncbi:MAG TPA: flavodoxin family protein [Patescibacteria group bacterium]|nr:flavodoxin family protein [Patescibacteria group bacterium]